MEWIFLGQWVSYFTFSQVFGFLDYSCGKYFKKREFKVVHYDKQTGRWLPWAFAIGVHALVSFCFLECSEDLWLASNQYNMAKWRDVTPMITWHHVRLCLARRSLQSLTLLAGFKESSFYESCSCKKVNNANNGVNLEALLSPFEPPGENPALADRLIIDPGWACPDSWPT